MSQVTDEEGFGNWREWPIETRGLTKRYRGVPVVDSVDLAVGPGEIYGFLGPNGAGKTTTMRMVLRADRDAALNSKGARRACANS